MFWVRRSSATNPIPARIAARGLSGLSGLPARWTVPPVRGRRPNTASTVSRPARADEAPEPQDLARLDGERDVVHGRGGGQVTDVENDRGCATRLERVLSRVDAAQFRSHHGADQLGLAQAGRGAGVHHGAASRMTVTRSVMENTSSRRWDTKTRPQPEARRRDMMSNSRSTSPGESEAVGLVEDHELGVEPEGFRDLDQLLLRRGEAPDLPIERQGVLLPEARQQGESLPAQRRAVEPPGTARATAGRCSRARSGPGTRLVSCITMAMPTRNASPGAAQVDGVAAIGHLGRHRTCDARRSPWTGSTCRPRWHRGGRGSRARAVRSPRPPGRASGRRSWSIRGRAGGETKDRRRMSGSRAHPLTATCGPVPPEGRDVAMACAGEPSPAAPGRGGAGALHISPPKTVLVMVGSSRSMFSLVTARMGTEISLSGAVPPMAETMASPALVPMR